MRMSLYDVTLIEAAVEYADSMYDGAPFANLSEQQIARRYAEWIVEFLREQGVRLTRDALALPPEFRCDHGRTLNQHCAQCAL